MRLWGRHRVALAIGFVGLAGLLAAAVTLATRPPSVHPDGAGALASIDQVGHESMSVDPARSGGTSWTFGLRLCLTHADTPVVLRRAGPGATLGTGFQLLGTRVRTFTPTSSHEPIISVVGYPPPEDQVPDELSEAIGFVVTTACTNGPRAPYTELLVGLRMTSDDGGGWKGLRIDYQVNGDERTLLVDHDLLICGRSDPVCEVQ